MFFSAVKENRLEFSAECPGQISPEIEFMKGGTGVDLD